MVLLVVQGSATFASARTSSPELLWERPLSAEQKRTIYRAAICADGTAFTVDSRGAVTGFDSGGTLIVETVHPDVFDTTAVACDESNRLLTWNGKEIVAFEAHGGLSSRAIDAL